MIAGAAKHSARLAPPRVPDRAKANESRILLFGDSHAHAVQTAIAKRRGKGMATRVVAHRLLKHKGNIRIGDSSLEDFLLIAAKARPNDMIVSMIGGNQHAVYSTIQHPRPFDFYNPEGDRVDGEISEIIPYRALENLFARGLRNGDGRSLEALRNATSARLVHVIPPPPKADNEHIVKYHETLFAADLPERGVSSPAIRLKFWKLQTRLLGKICRSLDIEILMPPSRAVDELGFLRPEYYAHDATHGNWLYGERILRQLEKIHPEEPRGKGAK